MKKKIFASALCALFIAAGASAQTDTLGYSPVGKSVDPSALNYPTGDLRNALTGLIPGLEVRETAGAVSVYNYNTASTMSLNSNNLTLISRGSSSIACMVDGIFVPFNSLLLDALQIESITLVDDVVGKAMLGPEATGSVLCIKTKNGAYNAPLKISAEAEAGLGVVDRFPEWVSGHDYVRLNNYARSVEGLTPQYTNPSGYASVNPSSMTYPNVDYRSLMLKDTKPMYRVGIGATGGSGRFAYAMNLGFLREEGIYKVNNNNFNRLNFSSSVRTRIGDWIEAGASFLGSVHFYNDNRVSLTDFRSTPAVAFPLYVITGNVDEDYEGMATYGVSRSFTENHYAELVEGGFSQMRLVNGSFRAFVDVDMSWLLRGLKWSSVASLQSFYTSVIGKTNDYLAYYYDLSTGTAEDVSDHKGVKATGKSLGSNSTYQQLSLREALTFDRTFGDHRLDMDAVFSLYAPTMSTNSNHLREANFYLSGGYSFRDRYSLQAVLQVAGSHILPRDNRYAAFPTVGFTWNAAKEDFIRNVGWIDALKLRAQWGIIGINSIYDTDFMYDANYSLSNGFAYGSVSSYKWFGSNTRTSKVTTLNRMQNLDLDWQKRHQVDLGFDARIFGSLDLSFGYFNIKDTDQICDITSVYPNVSGWNGITVYGNHNATTTSGVELSASWTRRYGDWKITLGANLSHYVTVWDKYLSAASNTREYIGHPTDEIWSYKYAGKVMSAADIASAPKHLDDLQIGDLLYEDADGDGEITDLDMQALGHTNPRLYYALNLKASWRNFDFTLVGTGRAFYQIALTNGYFWNGWGDSNYSKFVLDNLGGAYPRLSYTKSANSFVTSDFWLRDGDFFKIQNVELAYNIPVKEARGFQAVRVFARGANLLTISGIREVDPEYINSGVSAYPLFRTFTAGVKLSF